MEWSVESGCLDIFMSKNSPFLNHSAFQSMVLGVEDECTQGCSSVVAFTALVNKFKIKASSEETTNID